MPKNAGNTSIPTTKFLTEQISGWWFHFYIYFRLYLGKWCNFDLRIFLKWVGEKPQPRKVLNPRSLLPPKKSARKGNLRTRTHNFASHWNRELDRGAVAIYFFEVLIPDPRRRVWDLVDLVDHQRSGNVGRVDEWRAGVFFLFSNTSRYCEMEIDVNMDFIINMNMYFTWTFRFLYVQAGMLMHISKYTQTYFILIMYIYIHICTYKNNISANVNSCLSGLVWFTIPKTSSKSPENRSFAPKGNDGIPTSIFRCFCCFREGTPCCLFYRGLSPIKWKMGLLQGGGQFPM